MKNLNRILVCFLLSVGLIACGGGSSKSDHKSGKLISSKRIADYLSTSIKIQGIDSKYSVSVYKVVYETKNVDGQFVDASGVVSIPTKSPSSMSPIILYHHGTQYENTQAPTESANADSSWVLPSYLGFITIAPDYIGYGESQGILHPYLNTKITASTSIDLLEAAHTLLKTLNVDVNDQLFLGGYSQGGGAALATQRTLESGNKYSVTATSAGAGGYALSNELFDLAQKITDDYDNFTIVRPSNLGLILKAMNDGYHLNILNKAFKTDYVNVVDSIYDGTHSANEIDKKLSTQANKLLNKSFLERINSGEEKALIDAFKDNDLIDWVPKAPTQLYHGRDDDWVHFRNAQMAYDTMLAKGAEKMQLVECVTPNNQASNHANCFVPYLLSSYQFFLQYARDL